MIINQLINNSNLTQSEQQIAQYLLNKDNDIRNLTSCELGKITFTSQGSVTRLYKKLGIKNYRTFISTLIIEREEYFKYNYINNDNPGQYFTSLEDIQKVIFGLYEQTIHHTNLLLDKNVITRLCNRIISASVIDIYGIGISDIIAKQLSFKLQALGLPSRYFNGINELYIKNMKNKKSNVSILITLGGKNEIILKLAKLLKQNNIYTVLLTGKDENKENINLCSDYIIFDTSIFEDVDSMISIFSAEYVVNIIYASLIYRIQLPYTK